LRFSSVKRSSPKHGDQAHFDDLAIAIVGAGLELLLLVLKPVPQVLLDQACGAFLIRGSGGYSYNWSFVTNPSGCSMSAGNWSSCSVMKSFGKSSGVSWSATVQCVVTDNTGHSVAVQVAYGADWDSGN